MKPSLFLFALLLGALPDSLHAAPGTVQTVLPKIADGSDGLSLANEDLFGASITVLGDLDGDGFPELAVGASEDGTGGSRRGAVHLLFLDGAGSVTSLAKIAHGSGGLSLADQDIFGVSCTALGDLDGDDVPDLAVGASDDGTGGDFRGAVHVFFLNANGTVKSTTKIAHGSGGLSLADGDRFGISCTAIGDLDGDGLTELAVGAFGGDTGGDSRGEVHLLFLNANGTVKSTTKIAHGSGGLSLANSDNFGISCAALGDLDGDGVPELAAGATGDDTGGDFRGAIHLLFLNANGTVKSTSKIAHGSGGLSLTDGDAFGISCAALGDLDGDGVPDLTVGASSDNTGGPNRGAVHLLFLNASGTVKSTTKIADGSGGLSLTNNDFFGGCCAALGDVDVDGVPELAVGATGDNTGGPDRGAVHLLEIGDPPLTVTTLADEFDTPSGASLSLREAIRDADATTEFRTIRFDPALSGGVLSLLTGSLNPSTQSLRITGEGLDAAVTVQTSGDRIFSLAFATVTIDFLNLNDGDASGGGAFLLDAASSLVLDRVTITNCNGGSSGGGAIRSTGDVSISNSTFVDNTAGSGGAILAIGTGSTLTVVNSSFVRNSAATADGGGIVCGGTAATKIRYCTFVENSAIANGGGLFNDSGTIVVEESLFAGNTAPASPDFDSGVTAAGLGNAQVAASQLMPFGDYGGPTQTQPLKPTSTAKSTAFHRALPATDQRGEGFPRTRGTGRDPGAVEGTELSDFQPDNRIGLTAGKQFGNNRYSTTGQGQTVKLTLSGRRKAKTFFTVESDGVITDTIRVKSDKPNARSLNGKIFQFTGGRKNVSAQVFRTGLILADVVPGGSTAFQGEWSRKSATVKPNQTVKLRSTSTIALKSDVAGTKVAGK